MFFHPSFREWLIRRDDSESKKFVCDLRLVILTIVVKTVIYLSLFWKTYM